MTFVLNKAAAARPTPLRQLPVGCWARLCDSDGDSAVSHRLEALGFVPGTRLRVVRRAPFGGPIEIELRDYRICLRLRQLDGLQAVLDDEESCR